MRLAGSSRKNGLTLYSDHYAVTVSYNKKIGEYTYGLYRRNDGELVRETKKVPIMRGLTALWSNRGVKSSMVFSAAGVLSSVMLELNPESKKTRRFACGVLLAQCAFLGAVFYKTFGIDGKVRNFHGAEHKVINAYSLKQDEITIEEARRASRISRRCGTNYAVYVAAANMVIGVLPVRYGIFQEMLAMGIAYEAFRMPQDRCPVFKSTMDLAGDELQRKIMTREPEEEELLAAQKALNILVAAEKETLPEEESKNIWKMRENGLSWTV